MHCTKCGYEWDYRGKSALYLTCPRCYRKIKAKATISVEEIKAERAEAIEEITEDRATLFAQGGRVCGVGLEKEFVCRTCSAEFGIGLWDIKYARYCPICGAMNIRPMTKEESESRDGIVARINYAAMERVEAKRSKRRLK